MNRQKKAQRRFNVIDAVLLLLFAAGMFFLFRSLKTEEKTVGTVSTVEAVMRIQAADAAASLPAVGEVLTDADGLTLGTVTNVVSEPYTQRTFDFETDRFVRTPVGKKQNVSVTFVAECTVKDGRYLTKDGGKLISAGRTVGVRLRTSASDPLITSVREKEDAHEEQ